MGRAGQGCCWDGRCCVRSKRNAYPLHLKMGPTEATRRYGSSNGRRNSETKIEQIFTLCSPPTTAGLLETHVSSHLSPEHSFVFAFSCSRICSIRRSIRKQKAVLRGRVTQYRSKRNPCGRTSFVQPLSPRCTRPASVHNAQQTLRRSPPTGCTAPPCRSDLSVGGSWRSNSVGLVRLRQR